MGLIKNLIGGILGYHSCPITGDTYWRAKKYAISYSDMEAINISEEAFKKYSKEQIARIIYNRGQGLKGGKGVYSLEQITEEVESISRNL